jgi:hypothetical protein
MLIVFLIGIFLIFIISYIWKVKHKQTWKEFFKAVIGAIIDIF